MKIIRTLKADTKTIDRFLQHLADQDAGQKAKSGLSYTKTVPGMNGKAMEARTIINTIEPGCYSVTFEGQSGTTEMTYRYYEQGPGKTVLEYEETASGKNLAEKGIQKLNTVLFSGLIRKQISLRMDHFEKSLADFDAVSDFS